jgi:hypothetical protein
MLLVPVGTERSMGVRMNSSASVNTFFASLDSSAVATAPYQRKGSTKEWVKRYCP